jgi:hypothetical protein
MQRRITTRFRKRLAIALIAIAACAVAAPLDSHASVASSGASVAPSGLTTTNACGGPVYIPTGPPYEFTFCVTISYAWAEDNSGHIWATSNPTCHGYSPQGVGVRVTWCGYGTITPFSIQGGANWRDGAVTGGSPTFYARLWTFWSGSTSCNGGASAGAGKVTCGN